ncbi:unnamed protein product [Candida verbasci]|uniref:ABM domain-containing protein n=1 Tax=Candida verbasci TaxID=1227364 RepID=A0A9W4TTT8_9ASCO|nr:unnamed protein product [Candida verbasci]
MFAKTPSPPYYMVSFTSTTNSNISSDYEIVADRMVELAKQQPGYLGHESARDASGFGITISFWKDRISISNWKKNCEHQIAQERGKSEFYSHFETRIAKVEHEYSNN